MSIFNTQKFKIKRYSFASAYNQEGGYYYKGEWISQNTQIPENEVEGSIQPVSGEELQNLQEGYRDKEVYKGYVSSIVYNIGNLTYQDKIVWNGVEYKIIQVWKNNNGLINHFKFLMVKDNEESR